MKRILVAYSTNAGSTAEVAQALGMAPDKVRIINSLIGAGIRRMEVTSFVHPKAVPQLRDAAEVERRAHMTQVGAGQ